MNKQYTAAVIGLGRIGMDYDYSCATDQRIMTHSAAYHFHPGYILSGGVDPSVEKQELFKKKYAAPIYASLKELFSNVHPDVYSLAVPTHQHYDVFMEILSYQPKAILCEKPFSGSWKKAKEMQDLAERNNVLLFVNYMRRFEPGVQKIKFDLDRKILGKIDKVIVKYNNGFLNCAIHFLDLLQYFFGKIDSIYKIGKERHIDINKNIDVRCHIADIDIYFISAKTSDYAFYEMEIIGEQGVLRYYDAGRNITSHLSKKDMSIDETKSLSESPTTYFNDYHRFQWYVVDALYQSLSGKKNFSNIHEAVDILKVISLIKNDRYCE